MKEKIRGIPEVSEEDVKSWEETRRNRMSGELSFWRLRRSWLDTERDKVDQKIKELTLDMAETVGDLNYVYGKTETSLDLMVKKPKLFERILSRVTGSIRR